MANSAFKFTFHKKVYPAIDPSQPDFSAKGKTILITGGGKSIGKAITESFAIANASHIIILGRELNALTSVQKEVQAKHPGTTIHPCDVDISDAATCERTFQFISNTIGPIDVLILNAAYLHKPSPIATMDLTDFWQCFEINVKANTVLMQLFCKYSNQDSSTLIHVSSYTSWIGALPIPAQGYAASKAAFDMVVDHVAVQMPRMRCFVMHPGVVVSPMLEKLGADVSKPGFDDGMSKQLRCVLSYC